MCLNILYNKFVNVYRSTNSVIFVSILNLLIAVFGIIFNADSVCTYCFFVVIKANITMVPGCESKY